MRGPCWFTFRNNSLQRDWKRQRVGEMYRVRLRCLRLRCLLLRCLLLRCLLLRCRLLRWLLRCLLGCCARRR